MRRFRSQESSAPARAGVFTAVLAILAALATLLAHHRSTVALVDKNDAILAQSKASDAYNYYESRRLQPQVLQALADAGAANAATAQRIALEAKQQDATLAPILRHAQELQASADEFDERSDKELSAYEVMATAITLFNVAIIFSSISALSKTIRPMLYVAGSLGAAGMIFFIVGILRHF